LLKELKMEPLRRKLGSSTLNQSNSTVHRRMGEDLRRIGQQVTELPKIIEEDLVAGSSAVVSCKTHSVGTRAAQKVA
jgi:hypothetical protein